MENSTIVELVVEDQVLEEQAVEEQLTEEQLAKIEELKNVQKSIDFKIKYDKHIEEIVLKTTNVTGKIHVIKNSYDGTLPQWFTLPANATDATISICGGGGGGGGGPNLFWEASAAGGGGGETIWQFPLNNNDTIYSVIGKGGIGGKGNLGTMGENGANGSITIVEGSANFPLGGLRALGGNGGQGGRAYTRAYAGSWNGTSNPYSIGGQAGGHGGINNPGNVEYAQAGYPCYTVPGGETGGYGFPMGLLVHGGGGGGASMFGSGGHGCALYEHVENGKPGTRGGGGGGARQGSYIATPPYGGMPFEILSSGGDGGNGVVRVEYYI